MRSAPTAGDVSRLGDEPQTTGVLHRILKGDKKMCLYPRLIFNHRYKPNKKNNFNPPVCTDERLLYVPVKCGKCIECRRAKAREWKIRLCEEIKKNKQIPLFVTLTFSEEAINSLIYETGKPGANDIATTAMRRFNERWRKRYKKAIKHWCVSELGHNGTERVHLHGIIWVDTQEQKESISEIWKYGYVYIGKYVNFQTINYIVKYVTKIDIDHKGYEGIILCSPGIGKGYDNRHNRFNGEETNELYTLPNGIRLPMPIYYRNKTYTESEREELWLNKLNTLKRYVNGIEIDISKSIDAYEAVLTKAQEDNRKLGFGDNSQEWSKKDYLATNGSIQEKTRKMKQKSKFVQKRQDAEFQSLMEIMKKK